MAALHTPMLAMMPALYAKYAPIGLAEVAAALFALRILDALLDAVIGLLSDRTPITWGGRKLWVGMGLLLAVPTSYFLMRPGAGTGIAYFLIWTSAASLSWALVEISHGAWVTELSDDDRGRTALAFWRTEALYLGGLCFAAIPLLPFLSSTSITPESLAAGSWAIMAALLVAFVVMLMWAPVGGVAQARSRQSLPAVWRALIESAPLRLLTLQVLCSSLASGMVAALYFFFVDTYLNILDRLVFITLGTYVVGILAAPLWPPIIRVVGRSRVQAVSLGITALTVIAMAGCSRGRAGFIELAALFTITTALTVGREVNVVTMAADTADADEARSGTTKAGLFFATITIAQKGGIALGGVIALLVAAGFGFDPKASFNPGTMIGFFVAFTAMPSLLYGASAIFASLFPIQRSQNFARSGGRQV